jgi:hypothetical protein
MTQLALDITDGVRHYLYGTVQDGSGNKSDLFLPWSHTLNPSGQNAAGPPPGYGQDPWDHNTGVSIYMRYLLHAYLTSPAVKSHLQATGYPALVEKYATLLLPGRLSHFTCFNLQGALDGACAQQAQYSNALAATEAAIQMLLPKE